MDPEVLETDVPKFSSPAIDDFRQAILLALRQVNKGRHPGVDLEFASQRAGKRLIVLNTEVRRNGRKRSQQNDHPHSGKSRVERSAEKPGSRTDAKRSDRPKKKRREPYRIPDSAFPHARDHPSRQPRGSRPMFIYPARGRTVSGGLPEHGKSR